MFEKEIGSYADFKCELREEYNDVTFKWFHNEKEQTNKQDKYLFLNNLE